MTTYFILGLIVSDDLLCAFLSSIEMWQNVSLLTYPTDSNVFEEYSF